MIELLQEKYFHDLAPESELPTNTKKEIRWDLIEFAVNTAKWMATQSIQKLC